MKKLVFVVLLSMSICQFLGCSSGMYTNSEKPDAREREAQAALQRLYAHTSGARQLAAGAEAILIFPEITKAGLLIGGQYGTGVLFKHGQADSFYRSTAASYGLQAGVQQYGYAMFFMSKEDLKYLEDSNGWEVGVGPSITIVDKGFAGSMTTTTARKGVYVFFFEQKGLMAGLGIQGTKITKTDTVG